MSTTQNSVVAVQANRWRQVFWRFAVPPWASIRVTSNGANFRWRMVGAGAPFVIEGGPQTVLNSPLGWAGGYVEVLVRAEVNTAVTVVAQGLI